MSSMELNSSAAPFVPNENAPSTFNNAIPPTTVESALNASAESFVPGMFSSNNDSRSRSQTAISSSGSSYSSAQQPQPNEQQEDYSFSRSRYYNGQNGGNIERHSPDFNSPHQYNDSRPQGNGGGQRYNQNAYYMNGNNGLGENRPWDNSLEQERHQDFRYNQYPDRNNRQYSRQGRGRSHRDQMHRSRNDGSRRGKYAPAQRVSYENPYDTDRHQQRSNDKDSARSRDGSSASEFRTYDYTNENDMSPEPMMDPPKMYNSYGPKYTNPYQTKSDFKTFDYTDNRPNRRGRKNQYNRNTPDRNGYGFDGGMRYSPPQRQRPAGSRRRPFDPKQSPIRSANRRSPIHSARQSPILSARQSPIHSARNSPILSAGRSPAHSARHSPPDGISPIHSPINMGRTEDFPDPNAHQTMHTQWCAGSGFTPQFDIYGELVRESIEKNPWDAVGRPRDPQSLPFHEELRDPRESRGRFRTELSEGGGICVIPSESPGSYASRERRKRELRQLFISRVAKMQAMMNQSSPDQVDQSQQAPPVVEENSPQSQNFENADTAEFSKELLYHTRGEAPVDYPYLGRNADVKVATTTETRGENKDWKKQLGLSEDMRASTYHRMRKHEEGAYTAGVYSKADPTRRVHPQGEHIENRGFVKSNINDSKYAPASRVKGKNKRKVSIERIAKGVVVVRNAIDVDTQIWLVKIAKKEGAKQNHGFWAKKQDGSKTLNSTSYRGRVYDKLETYEDGKELKHYAQSICAKVREHEPDAFPMVFPTHLLLLHYANEKGIGWHADDAENDGTSDHPVISFCLGNKCKFGVRPIWNRFSEEDIAGMTTTEYKKHSFETEPELITLGSGDVILWGGIHRMLVHNVEEILPNTAPAAIRMLVKNVRYNFTFRDCSNIAGREAEFKYYIPQKGSSEETRNFHTFTL